MPLIPLLEHKNDDFVLEMPENGGGRRLKAHKILELALTALFLSAYISKIVFFGNSRIFVKILYIGVRIFYGFVGQWIP